MEALLLEDINAGMDNSPIQHYISSLQGCVNAGEAVLLDQDILLLTGLQSKVATIIRKHESACGFIVNLYVFPRPNGIKVPCFPVPWKRTYIGFPAQEVVQTQYVSALLEARLQSLVKRL
jgi:hypothetical protein